MSAESNDRSDDDAVVRGYRAASSTVDERPAAHVRAAVLAAAARAVDARPRDAARPAARGPFGSKRWGWSIAAALVVSVMTGVVAMNAWRERPDLVEGRATARNEAPTKASAGKAPVEESRAGAEAMPVAPRRNEAPMPATIAPIERPPAVAHAAPKKTRPRTADAFPEVADEPGPVAAPSSRPGRPAQSSPQAEAAATTPAEVAPSQRQARGDHAESATGFLARPPAAAPVARPTAEASGSRDEREAESPQAWIARIVRLRAAGRDDEADREVAKLHDRYPDFTIPREASGPHGTR